MPCNVLSVDQHLLILWHTENTQNAIGIAEHYLSSICYGRAFTRVSAGLFYIYLYTFQGVLFFFLGEGGHSGGIGWFLGSIIFNLVLPYSAGERMLVCYAEVVDYPM